MAKVPLGCEPVVGSLTPSKKREYKVTNRLQEGKRPIYAVVFNFIDSRYFNAFATAGGNRVTVYQCLEGGVIAVLQSYIDEDKDESFYTVSWACNIDGTPFLVAGGLNGIIRVIDTGSEKIYKSFVGHGDSINEIRTQPLKPSLVVSASKDESVRLWNIHTGICILIFSGAGGHRNEVLSVDFHPSDMYRIASCGMDNTVKIWSLKGKSYQDHSYQKFMKCVLKCKVQQSARRVRRKCMASMKCALLCDSLASKQFFSLNKEDSDRGEIINLPSVY